MIRNYFRTLLGILIFSSQVYGQIGKGGVPLRMQKKIKPDTAIIDMPAFDSAKVQRDEDSIKNFRHKGLRFAYNYHVNISPINSGTWNTLDGKLNVWSVTIRSKKAYALGLVLNNFKLKQNEKLYVYNKNEILGAFTSENNLPSAILPVMPVKGEEITVEFSSPYKKSEQGTFFIETVAHVYLNPLDEPGACNIDINCPEGANWQILKRAVCKLVIYTSDEGILCSGVLMNNTALDAKPYILTAQHCLFDNSDAARTVFYFNYESPSCNGPDGSQMQTLSGSMVRSTIYDYDFTLLELYNHPPMEFKPYMAGWSLETGSNLDTVVSIHHPQGGTKKLSISNTHPTVSTFVDGSNPAYATDAFWLIGHWDHGVTEGGSSGGPLLDRNHRVVATLTGGDAVCGNPINDNFERLVVSYDAIITPSEQLKYWLDPLNLGVTYLDGYDPFPFAYSGCDTISNINDTESTVILPYEYGKGYYSGNNSDSIAKFAEKFYTVDSLYLSGALFNIGRIGSEGELTVRVYEGNNLPDTTIFEIYIPYSGLTGNSINYIEFYPKITVKGYYYIGYEISYEATDTFNLYQAAPRYLNGINTAYIYVNNSWEALNKYSLSGWGSSFDIRPITCNTTTSIAEPVKKVNELNIYPCPAYQTLTISIPFNYNSIKSFEVFNLTGALVNSNYNYKNSSIELNLTYLSPGFYLIKINTTSGIYSAKFVKAK